MSFIDVVPDLEGGLQGLLNILGFAEGESTADALKRLYSDTDSLAVLTVKFVVAVLWWASHIASAAADARGYSAQTQAALKKADADMLATWQQWLNVKYPADLRKLYDDLTAEAKAVKKSIPKVHKVNLKPIEREIAALEKWKKVTVTPELKQWRTFYATWKKTYLPPMRRLINWVHKPVTMADFIALPLISVLPSKLRKPAAAGHAASIESALVATWTKNPDVIYNSILEWLVTA